MTKHETMYKEIEKHGKNLNRIFNTSCGNPKDAAFIVKIVNCHQELLEALKDAVRALKLADPKIKAATNIGWLEDVIAKATTSKI